MFASISINILFDLHLSVSKVLLSIDRMQKIIGNIRLLIDHIFSTEDDEGQRDTWKDMISQYSMAMAIFCKRSDCTHDNKNHFQDLIDDCV